MKVGKVAHSEQEVVQRQDLHLVEHFEAALRHVLHDEDPLLRSPAVTSKSFSLVNYLGHTEEKIHEYIP